MNCRRRRLATHRDRDGRCAAVQQGHASMSTITINTRACWVSLGASGACSSCMARCMAPGCTTPASHICCWRCCAQVFEKLGPSLYDFLRRNEYQPLPLALVQVRSPVAAGLGLHHVCLHGCLQGRAWPACMSLLQAVSQSAVCADSVAAYAVLTCVLPCFARLRLSFMGFRCLDVLPL
eukprot:GHRQ01030217.1.p1 GENE.GHRQ01030217.1~~GHRQ01030217.1.p1  ORF type:complete len:179 (-),score=43.30 GHRQ01030217.1:171-707(-)